MDGGAYCTLTPVVLSRGILHAGGPYHCPNTAHPRSSHGHEHAAQRRLPRLRGAAGRVRGRAPGGPGGRCAGGLARAAAGALDVPRGRCHTDRPAPAGERRVGRGPGTRQRGGRVRAHPGAQSTDSRGALGQAADAGRGIHSVRVRNVSGIGLAMAWHGAGFTGQRRGDARKRGRPRARRRRHRARPHRQHRDRPGHEDDLPDARGRGPGHRARRGGDGSGRTPRSCPDSGPTVASRTAMVVGGLVDQGRASACATRSRRAAAALRRGYRAMRATLRRDAHRRALRALPRHRVRRRRPTPATPTRSSAGPARSPRSTSTSTPARSACAASSPRTTSAASSTRSWPRARSRAARSRRSATPPSRR